MPTLRARPHAPIDAVPIDQAVDPRVAPTRPSMLRHSSRRLARFASPARGPADASADSSSVDGRGPAPKLPHVDGRRQ